MARVFLGLGSNDPGDRLAFLRAAYRRLASVDDIEVVAASPLYESEPWEREPGTLAEEQAWYLNAVLAIETTLAPAELLRQLHAVETALGRRRPPGPPERQRFAPHAVDIDILLYDDRVLSVPDDLHIPHLLLHERAFVLRPLADVAPDLEHPVLYRTVRDLLEGLEDDHEVRPAPLPRQWFDG